VEEKLTNLEEQLLKDVKNPAECIVMMAVASRRSNTDEEYEKNLKEEMEKYKKEKY